jgi:hypothetical protein
LFRSRKIPVASSVGHSKPKNILSEDSAGFSTFPTAEHDTEPFKGERSYGTGVGFSFRALAFVKDRCSLRVMDGLAREFVESLAKEFWANQAPVDPARFAPLRSITGAIPLYF